MEDKVVEPWVPTSLQESCLKAEEKTLDFEFEVVSVQFNEVGHYGLRLTVENPLLKDSGARVQLQLDSGEVLHTSTGITDVIEQRDPGQTHTFARRKFIFTLPKGFCKNDVNHDVQLRIEAIRLGGVSLQEVHRAGEAIFAIYPRPNHPRMNPRARWDEDLYHFSSSLALLRVQHARLTRHCGRLVYTVSFHEHRPLQNTPGASHPSVSEASGGTEESADASSEISSHLPHTKKELIAVILHGATNLPSLQDGSKPWPYVIVKWEASQVGLEETWCLAAVWIGAKRFEAAMSQRVVSEECLKEEKALAKLVLAISRGRKKMKRKEAGIISILLQLSPVLQLMLHYRSQEHSGKSGSLTPRALGWDRKISSEEAKDWNAKTFSPVSKEPTHSPTWEMVVTTEIQEENIDCEDVILTVADHKTSEVLAAYRIPVKCLHVFHPYHFELVTPKKGDPAGTKLYTSIMRKGSFIPRCIGFTYTALEVFLHGMNQPLKKSVSPIVVVVRVVTNYRDFMKVRLANSPLYSGLPLTTVDFPSPSVTSFDVHQIPNQGCPQISLPGKPEEQPMWNSSFLFQGRDGATLFTEDTALVLEYYPVTTVMKNEPWNLFRLLGLSVLPLNNCVYRKLVAGPNWTGLQVEGLPILGTKLETKSGQFPAVRFSMQLIGSERPDRFLTISNSKDFPSLNPWILDSRLEAITELRSKPSVKCESPAPLLPPSPMEGSLQVTSQVELPLSAAGVERSASSTHSSLICISPSRIGLVRSKA
ncbi:coiled-coil domain-containing protein 33-like [Tachyglossus aculeatus]|uniref:coiled-coil domain-containing protein 33-like n=1 Tax=Tachyglossus aculeatus TaxID=9261 RepID=UPI0018F2DE42|nr:coiled-coil domain-containing protein 33-like [Tachyglossus aculeatus]